LLGQANNSNSLICKSILEYGLSEFSLSILFLSTIEACLLIEQYYLKSYVLIFNKRRKATTAYNLPNNKLSKTVHVYNSTKTILLAKFNTISQFQLFSKLNGKIIKMFMNSSSLL
jgi:hypothetical protein